MSQALGVPTAFLASTYSMPGALPTLVVTRHHPMSSEVQKEHPQVRTTVLDGPTCQDAGQVCWPVPFSESCAQGPQPALSLHW